MCFKLTNQLAAIVLEHQQARRDRQKRRKKMAEKDKSHLNKFSSKSDDDDDEQWISFQEDVTSPPGEFFCRASENRSVPRHYKNYKAVDVNVSPASHFPTDGTFVMTPIAKGNSTAKNTIAVVQQSKRKHKGRKEAMRSADEHEVKWDINQGRRHSSFEKLPTMNDRNNFFKKMKDKTKCQTTSSHLHHHWPFRPRYSVCDSSLSTATQSQSLLQNNYNSRVDGSESKFEVHYINRPYELDENDIHFKVEKDKLDWDNQGFPVHVARQILAEQCSRRTSWSEYYGLCTAATTRLGLEHRLPVHD